MKFGHMSPAARRRLLLDLGIRLYVGMPDQFAGAGERAWGTFASEKANAELPGGIFFNGVVMSASEVADFLGEVEGVKFVDGQSSGQRKPNEGAVRSARYKAKAFQLCLVRTGGKPLHEAVSIDERIARA